MVDPVIDPHSSALAIAQPSREEEQFLRLRLIPDTIVALPIHYLLEVLTLSMHQVVPIPHLPPWVMGVHNWRGEILWMVDLGHLLGLTPWYQQPVNHSEFSAIILQQRDRSSPRSDRPLLLGLVVHEVDDMEWCDPRDIKPLPPTITTPKMAPFIQGCCWTDGGMTTIIDGSAIFNAMPASSLDFS